MGAAGTMVLTRPVVTERGWVDPVETSPTGRAMSVAVADAGITVLTSASAAWQSAQTGMATTLGPDAVSTLARWLDRCAGLLTAENATGL
jgi:hypothetical protein